MGLSAVPLVRVPIRQAGRVGERGERKRAVRALSTEAGPEAPANPHSEERFRKCPWSRDRKPHHQVGGKWCADGRQSPGLWSKCTLRTGEIDVPKLSDPFGPLLPTVLIPLLGLLH